MAWYVEYLLLNRELIRAEGDTESNTFNDLLTVELELKKFITKGVITPTELNAVNLVLNSSSLYVAEIDESTRETISKKFRAVGDRIGLSLGSNFTDEGYIEYMRKTYNLTGNQVETLRRYMTSHLRHKIVKEKFK